MNMDDTPDYSRLDSAFARFFSLQAYTHELHALEKVLLRLSFAQQSQGHNCLLVDDEDIRLLAGTGLVDASGRLPLVLEGNRLYLQRYWHYEQRLATQLKAMIAHSPKQDEAGQARLQALLMRHFPATAAGETDGQREAAGRAVSQAFAIITGGPGTGKTTTVVKILAVLQELASRPLLVALAAPTGKAAMRLQESIGASKAGLHCPESVLAHIPDTVDTLHRLLGARPAPSQHFRHHRRQPLSYDLVVVDEASMVDLALMGKLVDALKPGARLILLGDKDQLASVESGAVLADLVRGLPAQTMELQFSHRFRGAIKQLADAVNRQQAQAVPPLLLQDPAVSALAAREVIGYAAQRHGAYLRLLREGKDFPAIYAQFSQFQVLCANRLGWHSVATINRWVERVLAAQRLINPSDPWYIGRPVLVTQNDAALQLYNGDMGLCLPDPQRPGRRMVFFQRADGSVKKYAPIRMPPCETVYAMTIHKSQGSEFAEVLIVLPDAVNPVLTKELLYTAITRAKHTVRLVASPEVLAETIAQKVRRETGLVARLQSP